MAENLYFILSFFEIVSAGVLTYAIATSKADSRKIIKNVLIGTVVYAIVLMILGIGSGIGIVMSFAVFPVIFCILGSQTGNKFNIVGVISLVVYLFSLFNLSIISNKYEDNLAYDALEEIVHDFGGELPTTQSSLIELSYQLSEDGMSFLLIMFYGAIMFAILFFEMALLRRNAAQMYIGSIISVLTLGMLYSDYKLFHLDSFMGKIANSAVNTIGFSLSMSAVVILLFAILTAVTAYICDKKETERKMNK